MVDVCAVSLGCILATEGACEGSKKTTAYCPYFMVTNVPRKIKLKLSWQGPNKATYMHAER